MSNRVEELEQTVSELESTIEGLTEELVDAKERIRVLESQLEIDAGDYVEPQSRRTRGAPPAREAEPDEIEAAVEGDAGRGEAGRADVDESAETQAAADGEAEAAKAADTQDSEDTDDSGSELGDDIIVA